MLNWILRSPEQSSGMKSRNAIIYTLLTLGKQALAFQLFLRGPTLCRSKVWPSVGSEDHAVLMQAAVRMIVGAICAVAQRLSSRRTGLGAEPLLIFQRPPQYSQKNGSEKLSVARRVLRILNTRKCQVFLLVKDAKRVVSRRKR